MLTVTTDFERRTPGPVPDSSVTEEHVPFWAVLQSVGSATQQCLAERDPALAALNMAVVSVQSTFKREIFSGAAQLDVSIESVGSSSVTVDTYVRQSGHTAAVVRTVMVQVDPQRHVSVPLDEHHRVALQTSRDESFQLDA